MQLGSCICTWSSNFRHPFYRLQSFMKRYPNYLIMVTHCCQSLAKRRHCMFLSAFAQLS
ncbi:hypothetical protein KI387_018013, partial [Taxus chinensis]